MAVDHEQYSFSFSHAIITIADVQFSAISAVQFSQDIDRGTVYGTSIKPLKRAAGQLQMGEGTLTFSDVEEAMSFYTALGDNPSLALFSLSVALVNPSNGQTRSYECLSCALSGFSANFESGADALSMEVPFSFMMLKINGVEFAK